MLASLLDFANLMLAALVAGTLFGVWLFLNPRGLDAMSYATLQQQAIRTMNTVMPPLGAATIVATVGAAFLEREDHVRFWLRIAAALCFAAAGLITRLKNQPINAVVMTWRRYLPPSNWTILRDAWWQWHVFRLATGICGISLLFAAMLKCSANV
jgi:hypothetical protein